MSKTRKKIHGWNLATMHNEQLRPVVFNRPITEEGIRREDFHTSYVYRIQNTKNDKVYIGYHKEGDEVYYTSACDKEFQDLLASGIPGIFDYHILFWGSKKEAEGKEYELLRMYPNIRTNPEIYNLQYAQSKGIKPLDLKSIKKLQMEIDDIREFQNYQDRTMLKDGTYTIEEIDLVTLKEFDRMQTRELTIDSDNLIYIKSMVKNRVQRAGRYNDDQENYDMPVLLKDIWLRNIDTKELEFHDYILISGNHTRTAYYDIAKENKNTYFNLKTELKCLVIESEVTENMQEAEIYMLSNNLNRVQGGGKKFSKADGLLECIKFHSEGYTYKTPEMNQRWLEMGLTPGQIQGIFRDMEQIIEEEIEERNGYTVHNYRENKDDQEKLQAKKRSLEINNPLSYVEAMSSGNPSLYRLIDKFMKTQAERMYNGLPIQTTIQLLIYHPSFAAKRNWDDKLKEEFFRPNYTPTSFEVDEDNTHTFSKDEFDELDSIFKMPKVLVDIMPMKSKMVTKGKKIKTAA
jgi:hypothetical protein